jgi:hypothetical protein
MDTTGNPQSKRKHQRGGERDYGLDAQRRGAITPGNSGGHSDRPSGGSPSKQESEQHSRGARKSGQDENPR